MAVGGFLHDTVTNLSNSQSLSQSSNDVADALKVRTVLDAPLAYDCVI